MGKELYVHFHPDEHAFVDKAMDWVERAAAQHAVRRTDFLDPRQRFIVSSLAGRFPDVTFRCEGGYPDAERQRVLIGPDYLDLEHEDAGIAVLAVRSGESKFLTLEHGDFLGSILGLGIKRDKIGDIHVHEDGCHFLVAEEVSDYLRLNLRQVHRVQVETEILPLDRLRITETKLTEMDLTVASMRLDGIASDVYRLSRSKVLTPIQAGRCKVNFRVEEDPSKPLKEGDVVSLQGFGRFKLLEVEGITKKGRYRLKIGKFS